MLNSERLQLEIQGITLATDELAIYLQENGLEPNVEYNPQSNVSKRNILRTALSILESIANNPGMMKSYKHDDMTISDFSDSIQSRIDQLERKIRQMANTDENSDSNYFMLFQE